VAKYLVLIYGDEAAWQAAPAEWHATNGLRHQALIAAERPSIRSVEELEPAARAVSIRADATGRAYTTDGPFLETKEVIGGYYLLDAPDMAEAIRIASQIPEATAAHGGVEIRPIAVQG
jgi:hypothetical protein